MQELLTGGLHGLRVFESICSITCLLLILSEFSIFQLQASATLLKKPDDCEAVISQVTFFNCSSLSQEIHWFYYDQNLSSNRRIVYENGQFSPSYRDRFRLERNDETGESNLVIPFVLADDAGEYECHDDNGRGDRSSAKLIVLDSVPVCESNATVNEVIGVNNCNIPSTSVLLSCSVTYHGQDPPLLEWIEGVSGKSISDTLQLEISGNRIVYNLTLKSETIKNGSKYKCRSMSSRSTTNECTVGPFKVTGTVSDSSNMFLVYITIAVAVFVLLLAAILSFGGGIFLQTRRPLRLFVSADEKERKTQELSEIKISPESRADSLMVWMNMAQSSAKENENLLKDIEEKTNEVHQLEIEKQLLENRLYSSDVTKYTDKPIAVGAVEIPDSKNNLVTGLAILKKELFVAQEKVSEVSVYNFVTLKFKRTIKPVANFNPLDLVSCSKNECLYLCVTRNEGQKKEILRFEEDGSMKKTWTVGNSKGTLSVYSRDTNVIVCSTEEDEIQEYTCNGVLIQTAKVSLSSSVGHLFHAIKTTNKHFLICHGNGDDTLHRVCAIDSNGVVLKSYGKKKGSDNDRQQMNRPIYLTEDANGNILVADMKNNRILLLSSTLEFQRELISAKFNGLRFPNRISLDEERGRLFVADVDAKKNNNCRIIVFNIRAG